MSRWTPPAVTFVVGLLLAGGVGLLSTVATGTACSTQETTQAPDATLPPCKTGPFIFCHPVGADMPSCNTDDGTSRWLTRLQRGMRYPVGCVVDYVGERDEQGDCKLEAVCKCILGEIPATPAPDSDAGTDGGDASMLTPPPDAGPSTTGPVWNCYP